MKQRMPRTLRAWIPFVCTVFFLKLNSSLAGSLVISPLRLTTPQNVPIWVNLSKSIAGANENAYLWHMASVPQEGRGEIFSLEPSIFIGSGKFVQGLQIKAGDVPFELLYPYVLYVPTPHKFSCSVCNETNPSDCTICIPYANLSFFVKSGSQQSNTALAGVIVKQNSDAPFAGGGGGALYLDGYDDFAVASIPAVPPHAITVAMWVKNQRARPLQTLFSIFSTRGRELEVHNTIDLQALRGNSGATPKAGVSIADGAWHHVAVSLHIASGACTLMVDAKVAAVATLLPGVPLAEEAELFIGQRPVCGGIAARFARQRRREERHADFLRGYNVTQPDGRVYRVCAADVPTRGCDVFYPEYLRDTFVWALDNEEVLRRDDTRPTPAVERGAWRCAVGRVCTQGAMAVTDAFACECVPGCMEPTFAFNGFVDEIRLYSIAKTPLQLSFDSHFALGSRLSSLTIGRPAQHWQHLFLYFGFDGQGMRLDGGTRQEPSMQTDGSSTLLLGGGPEVEISLPQRIMSTAPIFGAYAPLSLPMDASTAVLVKIPIFGNLPTITSDVANIDLVRCRILAPMPIHGKIYQVEYDTRLGFGIGKSINTGKTILQPLTTVEATHGIETCIGTQASHEDRQCSRQGYYIFYIGNRVGFPVADELAFEVSASPFLDDKGNEIPVVSVISSLVVYSRQLPLPVHFTEEVFESQPRVVHLPILSRTDEALHIAIASLPNSGILHHLLDVPQSLVRDIDTVQGRAPSEALPGAGVLQDIQAPLKYCDSSALSDTRILSAAGDVSWPLLSLAHDLHQASCTPLPGDGFLARICRAYLNGSSVCAVFPNATCTCAPALTQLTTASGRSVQCLGPEYSAHTTPLSDIRVRASASYLIIAALLGHASSVTWLLSVGAVRHELAMQVAAGAGNSEIVGLLLSGKSPWNDRALAAARLRGHIDVILTLDAARLRALAGEHNGYVSSARAMVTDAMDRCFVRGPAFASITGMGEASGGVGGPVGSIGVVHDPEMRVLFVPTRYDPSSPLIFHFQASRTGNWEANDGALALSATATLEVIPQRDLPLAHDALWVASKAEDDLIYINLPMKTIENTSAVRARILVFPKHGELYNVIPTESTGSFVNSSSVSYARDLLLGGRVAMAEDKQTLLPVHVLNYTREGVLHPLPPGPWKGSLYHPPITTCKCRPVCNSLGSGKSYNVEKQCGVQGEFETACGARGSDVVILQYAHKVHPEEIVLTSWLPDSARLRVLALHPPATSAVWHPVSGERSQSSHFVRNPTVVEEGVRKTSSVILAVKGGIRDGSRTHVHPSVHTTLTGCAGHWEPLWEGVVVDIRDTARPGHLRIPVPPPNMETDTLLLQVCGLKGMGIGLGDGGNMLNGTRGVVLRGTRGGAPRGLVFHPGHRLAYRRFPGAKGLIRGGLDNITWAAFDGGPLIPPSGVMSVQLPPRVERGREVQQAVYVSGDGRGFHRVPLVLLEEAEGGGSGGVNQHAIITRLPTRGRLGAQQGGGTLPPFASHTCGSTVITGSLVSFRFTTPPVHPVAEADIFYQTYPPGSRGSALVDNTGAYDSIAYTICSSDGDLGSQVVGQRVVSFHLECRPHSLFREELLACVPCPAGTETRSSVHGAVDKGRYASNSCSLCMPGFNRSESARKGGGGCEPCPRGTATPFAGTGSCIPCAPGTYAAYAGSVTCESCPTGKSSPAAGATTCTQCGTQHYGPVPGLSACKRCPARTVSTRLASTSINECECAGGSYHQLARIGEECEECPHGMYCQGALLPPVQTTGFWSLPEIYPEPSKAIATPCDYRNVRGVCIGYPNVQNQSKLQLCLLHPENGGEGREGWCPWLEGGVDPASWPNLTGLPGDQRGGRNEFLFGGTLLEEAWATGVNPNTFLGAVYNKSRLYRDDAHCTPGYTGRMCSECASRYYRVFDGTCATCPWWGFFATYMAWFGVWGLACSLLCLCAMGQSHFARTLVHLAQAVHLVSQFHINWPPFVMYALRSFAIFNFSLEMLPWTCYGVPMGWIDQWFLSLFLPYVITLAVAIRYLMPYIITTELYFHARRQVLTWQARFVEWPNNPMHKLVRVWERMKENALVQRLLRFVSSSLPDSPPGSPLSRGRTCTAQTDWTNTTGSTATSRHTTAASDALARSPLSRGRSHTLSGTRFGGGSGRTIAGEAATAKTGAEGACAAQNEKRGNDGDGDEVGGGRTEGRTSRTRKAEEIQSQTDLQAEESLRHTRMQTQTQMGTHEQVHAQAQAAEPRSWLTMLWTSMKSLFVVQEKKEGRDESQTHGTKDAVVRGGGEGVDATLAERSVMSAKSESSVDSRRELLPQGQDSVVDGGGERRVKRVQTSDEPEILFLDYESSDSDKEPKHAGEDKEEGEDGDDEDSDEAGRGSSFVPRKGTPGRQTQSALSSARGPAGPNEEGEGGAQVQEEAGGDALGDTGGIQGKDGGEAGGAGAGGTDPKKQQQEKKKKRRRRKKEKSAASLHAQALRAACIDAAFKHSVALAQLFLVQSSMRMTEIITCRTWSPTLSTLEAFPAIACAAIQLSSESMSSAATAQADRVQESAAAGAPQTSDSQDRPAGAIAMAVMLYPPHLFLVLMLGNLHVLFRLRLGQGLGRCSVKYHALIAQFEPSLWWWNVVVSLRQLALTYCLTLKPYPERQILVSVLACSANMVGVLVYRPYTNDRTTLVEAAGQLALVALLLTGLLNPTDLTMIDPETLAFPNDGLVSWIVFVLGVLVTCLVWVLGRRDVAESQFLTPWWVRLLRLPFDIVWGLLSRSVIPVVKLAFMVVWGILRPLVALFSKPLVAFYRLCFPVPRQNTPRVHPEPATIEPPVPPPTPSGTASWARDKFTTRRHLYKLERALVEEVEWDAKSSKAGLLEMQISEALNRSHELLMQESEELYATWYDDETALEALTHELASLKQKLKQKARQLQGVREENAQLQAQIEVAVRKQRVPEAILERRQALEEVTRQARSMISAEEEELIQLELTLLDAELGP